jgi:hypothetical protein
MLQHFFIYFQCAFSHVELNTETENIHSSYIDESVYLLLRHKILYKPTVQIKAVLPAFSVFDVL